MGQTENDYVAVIDLGTTKIVASVAKKTAEGKLQIIGLSSTVSTGIKKGMINNVEDTVNSIQQTVDDLKKKTGIDFNSVYVGIAGQHIRSIKSRGGIVIDREGFIDNSEKSEINQSDVNKLYEDMHRIALEPGEIILHVLPLEFFVDGVLTDRPVGMIGRRLEANFHIVIGRGEAALTIGRCLKRCQLEVNDYLILEPLASSEAVLTQEEKEEGVVLIDIGGGTTDLAVFKKGNVRHTAVIPFGGDSITYDIMVGCDIAWKRAQLLKEKYGYALPNVVNEQIIALPGINGRPKIEISTNKLAGIIESRFTEILGFVLFEIEKSGLGNQLRAGVVITGGGALLSYLSHLIRLKSGYDVRIGFPIVHLSPDSIDAYNYPQFSTAIGLSLLGYDVDHTKVEKKKIIVEDKKEFAEDMNIGESKDLDNTKPDVIKEGLKKIKNYFNSFIAINEDDEIK